MDKDTKLVALAVAGSALAASSVYLHWRLARLQCATLHLLSAVPDSEAWVTRRGVVASLLGQRNSYCTWSLSLAAARHERLLYSAAAAEDAPDVAPARLGVSAASTAAFLKGLDLGGRDQREIRARLAAGDRAGAERILIDNKQGSACRAYILTGGPLAARRESCARLAAAFPAWGPFVAVHPEAEGRGTLRAAARELRRLARASGGATTHALLVAKGSTDVHLAWLSAARGVATASGCAVSAVHRPQKADPSCARAIFEEFVARPANAELAAAAHTGKCAIVFAGYSMYDIGEEFAARGNYFRPLAPAELAAADAAEFERFVGLEWCGGRNTTFIGARTPGLG